jgi:hypothetical protein
MVQRRTVTNSFRPLCALPVSPLAGCARASLVRVLRALRSLSLAPVPLCPVSCAACGVYKQCGADGRNGQSR